jgi:hypothetical protein
VHIHEKIINNYVLKSVWIHADASYLLQINILTNTINNKNLKGSDDGVQPTVLFGSDDGQSPET